MAPVLQGVLATSDRRLGRVLGKGVADRGAEVTLGGIVIALLGCAVALIGVAVVLVAVGLGHADTLSTVPSHEHAWLSRSAPGT